LKNLLRNNLRKTKGRAIIFWKI